MNVTEQEQVKRLAKRYALITLAVMSAYKIRGATPKLAARGPRHLSLGMKLASPVDLNLSVRIAEQIALSSQTENVLAYRQGGLIVYQFGLKPVHWKTYTRGSVPNDVLGVGENNSHVKYQFIEARPHAMFAGTTGSGKTTAIKSTLFSIAQTYTPDELQMAIVDKFNNFEEFDNLAHLAVQRARSEEEIEALIIWAEKQLEERIATDTKDGPRLVLVLDEVELVFTTQARINRLKAIAKGGRQFRINIIAGGQQFKETDLPGIPTELNYRFIGMVSNASISSRLTGQTDIGAHRLMGEGDFIQISKSGVTRFQFADIKASEYNLLPRAEIEPVPLLLDTEISTTVQNLSGELTDKKPGRPSLEIDPELVAWFLYHFPKRPSLKQGKERGISRAAHELNRGFFQEMMKAYINYLEGGMEGYL